MGKRKGPLAATKKKGGGGGGGGGDFKKRVAKVGKRAVKQANVTKVCCICVGDGRPVCTGVYVGVCGVLGCCVVGAACVYVGHTYQKHITTTPPKK